MDRYNIIEIAFKDGHTAVWEAEKGEWDDYSYDGSAFIVKKAVPGWASITWIAFVALL